MLATCPLSTMVRALVLIRVGCLFSLPLVSSKVGDFFGASGAKQKLIDVTLLGSSTTGAQLVLLKVGLFG